jgi:DNA ligase-1
MDERTHPTQPDRRHWLARASAAVGWAWCGAGLAPSAQAARSSTTPLLAREWTPGDDPRDWLVSEKLDGVRALWDGHQLRFRSGRLVQAPAEFLARLPAEPMDGELWLGRGRFDELSGVVRRRGADAANWRAVQYHVFELPAGAGSFAQRAQRLQAMAQRQGWPQLQAAPQRRVANAAQLQALLDQVVAQGGEGLMLHRADAGCVTGRSEVLRKFKPLQDAEGVVVAHQPGQGQFSGLLGALQVRSDDGRVFDVGTGFSQATRAHPPAVGQRITYTHRGLTSQGLPRFASYLRQAPEL